MVAVFLRPVVLRPVALRAVVLRAVALRVVALRVVLRAPAFEALVLRVVVFGVLVLRAGDFFVEVLRDVDFFAERAVVEVLRLVFFAVDDFLRVVVLRAPETARLVLRRVDVFLRVAVFFAVRLTAIDTFVLLRSLPSVCRTRAGANYIRYTTQEGIDATMS